MQHTDIPELNACISYLRTGKEVSRADQTKLYDMTWTFTAPRDPAITELFVGSPGNSFWLPTAADIKAEQQRKLKEREEDARRTVTPQPIQKPALNSSKEMTPVPLSGLRAPLEFKKKPVITGQQQQQKKSLLSAELSQFKKGGAVSMPAAAPNVPSVKFTIYLPNRRGVEVRIPKTATVEQAIPIILERCRDFLGKKRPDRFELRMHDADGLPDDDFPALDKSSVISEMGSNEFCLCDLRAGDEDTDDDESSTAPPTPAATPSVASPPTMLTSMPSLTRTKSERKPNSIRVLFMDNLHDQSSSIIEFDPEDARASSCLRKIVRKYRLPLFADEYQLQIREEDKEKLGMLTSVLYPNDDVLALGVDIILVCKRRFADAPPDADHFDHLQSTVGKEARRVSENKRIGGDGQAQHAHKDVPAGGREAGGKGQAGQGEAGAAPEGAKVPGGLTVTIQEHPRKEEGLTTPGNVISSRGAKSSATKSIKKPTKTSNAVDPDSILLNEIKAAVYEEWKVVKTNNWGKNQNRILGIDLQKIYNKPRSEGGFGQSVKHAERLIADVVSIDLNPHNPAAFTIKVRDGPGNAVVVLNYEAENADDAAKIVAKIKYIRAV